MEGWRRKDEEKYEKIWDIAILGHLARFERGRSRHCSR
jgi:hypothetical protein